MDQDPHCALLTQIRKLFIRSQPQELWQASRCDSGLQAVYHSNKSPHRPKYVSLTSGVSESLSGRADGACHSLGVQLYKEHVSG